MKLSQYQKDKIRNKMNKVLSKLSMSLCKPTSIHMSITNKCSLQCKQCDIWKKQHNEEISTRDVKKIISDLREWLGKFTLNIAGGEPFTRKDIFEIIEFATKKGITVSVTTNGHLIDKKMAEKILSSGLKNINISLDGINPETHDYIRNKKGCFDKVTKAIEYLNKPDREQCLVIATVFMGYNLKELVQLTKWVDKQDLNGIIFQPLYNNFGREYDPQWYKNHEFWPKDPNEVDKVLDSLIEMKKKGSKIVNPIKQLKMMKTYFRDPNQNKDVICKVGDKNYAVNEKGEAMLCFELNPVGNNLKQNSKNIWTSDEAKKRRKQIKSCTKNCKLLNCHFD